MLKLWGKRNAEALNFVEITFECQREGLTIRGTEYRPEGENLPIAIVSHGFMAFQDTVRQYAKALAGLGYVSYCFDFNGGCVVKGRAKVLFKVIEGGAHGFSKKHDVLAIDMLREFVIG